MVALGAASADRLHDRREVRRAAVVEVVAVDRRDDDMPEAHRRDRLAHAARLVGIERSRQPRAHVAERAGARAGVAHDHQRRVLLGPALADVRAARLLADGVQPPLAHDAPGLEIARVRRGRLTRIQLGLRSRGVSGRFCFSGWRGGRLSRMVTMVLL